MAFKKGHKGHWKGKKLSDKHKKNLRGARESFTMEHKKKISESLKRFWRKMKKNISST